MADRAIAADVEHFPVARIARPGAKKRVGDVVYVHEVAQLGAVAVDLDRLVLDREPDEPRDEPLATVFDQLPRAVDVRQAKRARAHAEDVVVQQVVVLARGFVDAVDVRWPDEVHFGDGQRFGPAVHLARAGEHELRFRVVVATRLENRQLTATVDLEIRVRVAHAVDVAHLSREVEDHVAVTDQIVHGRLLPHVRDVDAQAIGDAVDVEQIAAVIGNQRIDEQHVGAGLDQLAREVAPDEAEAAGDHDAPAAVELPVLGGHGRGGLG